MIEQEIKYKGKKIQTIEKEVVRALQKGVNRLAVIINAQAKLNAPRVTGTLKRSINIIPGSPPLEAEIRAGAGIKYAIWVEEGTPPHVIKPKRAKSLHWIIKIGGMVGRMQGRQHAKKYHFFAKSVNHPGTKGQFFMKRAFEYGKEQANKEFSNQLELVMRNVE